MTHFEFLEKLYRS